jgi:outer membrane protein OmpA-like peptidoglycan-associated protein
MKLVHIGPPLAALLVASCAANSRQVTAQRAAQHAEEDKQEAREEAQEARHDADKKRLDALEATREQREAEQNAQAASQRAALAEAQAGRPLPGATERQGDHAIPAAISKNSVFFAASSADLTSDDKGKIDEVARSLRDGAPGYSVVIEGYSDDTGAESDNVQLSRRRADAVANYLASKGIQGERITTKALGSHNLANKDETVRGRGLNRRVEIVIRPAAK